MGLPFIKEELVGVINGINKIFFSSVSYKPNTTNIYLNGLLQSKTIDFYWTENGFNKITLNEAPQTGDTLQIGYIPI